MGQKIFLVFLGVQSTQLCHWFEKLEQPIQPISRKPKPAVNMPRVAQIYRKLWLVHSCDWRDVISLTLFLPQSLENLFLNIVIVTEPSEQVTIRWSSKVYRKDAIYEGKALGFSSVALIEYI